jgi:transposase
MPKSRKSARADDRKIMNAIFYAIRTGMPWRDLPERCGPYIAAYDRFNRWSRRGIWKRIFDTLASKLRDSLSDRQHDRESSSCGQRGKRGGATPGDRH